MLTERGISARTIRLGRYFKFKPLISTCSILRIPMMKNKWLLLSMDRLLGCVSWVPFLANGSLMGKWLDHGDSSSHHRFKEDKALTIQCGWRRLIARRRLQRIKEEKSALTLQLSWRQLLARKQLQKLKKISNEAALTCQSGRRQLMARRKLQKLKRGVIENLKKEVEDLKTQLELEQNVRELLEKEKKSSNDMLEAYAKLEEKNEKLVKELEDSKNENDSTNTRLEETISKLKAEKQVILDTLASLKGKKRSDDKSRKSSNDKKKEREELLIRCISQEIGFSNGRPIGACIVYKCLLQWGSFQSEKTTIFNRIVQAISSVIEGQENIGLLAYWLTNSTMLLSLLQPLFKSGEAMPNPASSASVSPTCSPGSNHRWKTAPSSFWGKLSQSMKIPQSPSGVSLNNRTFFRSGTRHFEARDPTVYFKSQVSDFIEKIYGDLRDKLKNEISPVLDLCVQNTNTSEENPTKDAIDHWKTLVKILDKYLKTTKANYVPRFLISKLFSEILSYINMKLFNSLLSQPECCSFSNGGHLKAGLFELNKWLSYSLQEYRDNGLDELNHINQAVALLVTDELRKKTFKEITDGICPSLNTGQLCKLSTMCYDDKSSTLAVSPEVISSMRAEMEDPKDSDNSNSLLLEEEEEEEAGRFSEDDFSSTIKSMPIDISDVEPPPLIRQSSQFSFIRRNFIE